MTATATAERTDAEIEAEQAEKAKASATHKPGHPDVVRYAEHIEEITREAAAENRPVDPNAVNVELLRKALKKKRDLVLTQAEQTALKNADAAEQKAAKKAKAGSRASAYPEEIRTAAKRVREILGGNHAPGPKQHAAVRKAAGADPKALGLPKAAMLKYAQGGDVSDAHKTKLGELAKKVGDPFARGRSLAAILVAWLEEK